MSALILISFVVTFIITKLTISLAKSVLHPARDFVPQTEYNKVTVSPFGGSAIFASCVSLCLFFAGTDVILFLIPSIFMFFLGLLDDIKKISSKKHDGISASSKFICQILAGAFVCAWSFISNPDFISYKIIIPFWKVVQFKMPVILICVVALFAYVGTINAVNLTDGLDGLAGKQCLAVFVFLLFASSFFNVDEMLIKILFIFLGGILAFLWFNSNPASIFMGDSGSMGLGSLIATFFIVFRIELLLPIVGFVFFMEALSVILQVGYFKMTKGKRIFKMSPIHHHFQINGMKEQKITELAFLITIILSVLFITPFV